VERSRKTEEEAEVALKQAHAGKIKEWAFCTDLKNPNNKPEYAYVMEVAAPEPNNL